VPRRRWLLANLFLVTVGCTVPNPAYLGSDLVDGGGGEPGGLDALGSGGQGGSPGDGSLDLRKADGPSLDVAPGTPDLNVGDAVKPPGGDTAPVTPDAAPMMPDTAPVTPDAAPVIPDTAPVTPDLRPDLPAPPAEVNPPPPVPMGTGLRGQYFDGSELEKGDTGKLVLQRTEGPIDFDWGTGSVTSDIDDDWFSVRWTGQVMPLHSETYVFRTVSDEGVRLWVNGTQVINSWVQQSTGRNGNPIFLEAYHRYDIKLEYFEQTGSASVHLYWSSPSQPSQLVPKVCLYAP
jgi:mannan endo-1,4-beta-mannosidase